MELIKAIELNTESERSLRKHKFIDYADAVKIGNAAMKRLAMLRSYGVKDAIPPLPGEG